MEKQAVIRNFLFLAVLFWQPIANASDDAIAKAQLLYDSEKFEEALQIIDIALQETPQNQDALFLRGNIELAQAKYTAAIGTFSSLDPELSENPEVLNNLAIGYAHTGETRKAIETLRNALNQDKRFGTLYFNLSNLYAFLAKQAYEKAIESKDESGNTVMDLPDLKRLSMTMMPPVTAAPAVATPAMVPEARASTPQVDIDALRNQVAYTVYGWAQAWSAKDVTGYIKYYASDFKTPVGMSRGVWENYRRDRLAEPKFIQVNVEDFDVELASDGSLAIATFVQKYRSDTYKETARKQLVLRRIRDEWRIFSEYSEL